MACLPNEILSSVFSHLQPGMTEADDRKSSSELWNDQNSYPRSLSLNKARRNYATLANISLASKAFRSLAQPILYGTLIVDDFNASLPLLKSLCRHPNLGELVDELHLHLRGELDHSETNQLQPWFAMVSPRLGLRPLAMDRLICDDLGDVMNRNCRDAVMTFWLALTPNIKRLSMSIPSHPAPNLLPLLIWKAVESPDPISSAPGSKPRFSQLQEVYLQPGDYDSETGNVFNVYDGTLVALLRIPSLQKFHGYCICMPWVRWMTATSASLVTRRYNVRHIELDRTFVQGHRLDLLFSNCPKLQSLRLNLYISRSPSFTCDELGNQLREHGQELESLELSFYVLHHTRGAPTTHRALDHQDDLGGMIGNLRNLQRLRNLSISLHALIGLRGTGLEASASAIGSTTNLADILPDTLERLELTDVFLDTLRLGEQLCNVAVCARLLNLRSIILPSFPDVSHFIREISHVGLVVETGPKVIVGITKSGYSDQIQPK